MQKIKKKCYHNSQNQKKSNHERVPSEVDDRKISTGSSNVYKHIILNSLDSYTSISVQRAWENVFSLAVS